MVLPLQLQDISNMRKSFYRPQGKVKKNQIRISLVWLHGAGGFCSRKYCSLLAWWASKGLWESFGKFQITDTEVVSVRNEIVVLFGLF